MAIAADGSKLFDESFDPFAEIAADQPLFEQWRSERMKQTVAAPDGSKHCFYSRVLAEARSPEGKGNLQVTPRWDPTLTPHWDPTLTPPLTPHRGPTLQATEMTVTLAEVMATAALTAMRPNSESGSPARFLSCSGSSSRLKTSLTPWHQ